MLVLGVCSDGGPTIITMMYRFAIDNGKPFLIFDYFDVANHVCVSH